MKYGNKANIQNTIRVGGLVLENSVIEKDGDLTVRFTMASYGKFVDKGVSGTEVTRSFKDYKGKTLKSPFGYRKAKGQIVIEGKVHLTDIEGNPVKHGNRFTLCGCTKSKDMPFCDGSHKN